MMPAHLSYSQGSRVSTTLHSNSICLINCYFGSPPQGIAMVLQSFARNASIDFLIFSDCISDSAAPANVTIVPCTLQDVAALAAEKLDLSIDISQPYKLCDFYAAYGKIFEAYLGDYAFWGTVDLDVLLGDVAQFITPALLANHDVISGHQDYVAGHFTLYRNTPPFNTLYLASNDYKKVFQSKKFWGFEECAQSWMAFRMRKNSAYSASPVESMTHVLRRLTEAGEVRACFKPFVREGTLLHKTQWLLGWERGRLYDVVEGQEIMYFHFHMLGAGFHIPSWSTLPETFYINKRGFFT